MPAPEPMAEPPPEDAPAYLALIDGIADNAARFVVAGGPLGAALALHAIARKGVFADDARAYLLALVMEEVEPLTLAGQRRVLAEARRNLDAAAAVAGAVPALIAGDSPGGR